LLADAEAFMAQVARRYPDDPLDRALQAEVHATLSDPPVLHRLLVAHLRELWAGALAAEWARVAPPLRGLVGALGRRAIPAAPAAETIRAFAGRDLPGDAAAHLAGVRELVFVPSPHLALHASRFGGDATLWVFVGAATIAGWTVRQEPAGRGELLRRLEALADETRLRILELLAAHEELFAREIIARLDLTQSSASRHLGQLRGLGYLTERRGEGANKAYRLNRAQFDWTFRALERLLAGEDTGAAAADARAGQPAALRRFLDAAGRVARWPAKQRDQAAVLTYLASQFEPGREYGEREVNELLDRWAATGDHATLRRALYDARLLGRTSDGARYWPIAPPAPQPWGE
jgi:hypothetical protein